jgi:hypothetical protein
VKLKALVALIALGLAGASLAYAAPKAVKTKPSPTPGNSAHTNTNGKKPSTTDPTTCRPRVVVIVKGTFDGAATDNSYIMVKVTGGNRFARPYKIAYKNTQVDLDVLVTASTKYKGPGHNAIGDLKTGDKLVIRAPSCKAALAGGATPPLTATRVLAHTPKS